MIEIEYKVVLKKAVVLFINIELGLIANDSPDDLIGVFLFFDGLIVPDGVVGKNNCTFGLLFILLFKGLQCDELLGLCALKQHCKYVDFPALIVLLEVKAFHREGMFMAFVLLNML
jgi:hypothetical protein